MLLRELRVAREPGAQQEQQSPAFPWRQVVLDRVENGLGDALLDRAGRKGLADRVERAHDATLNLGECHLDGGEAERPEQSCEHLPRVPLGPVEQAGAVAGGLRQLLLGEWVELALDARVLREDRAEPVDDAAVAVVHVAPVQVELGLTERRRRQLEPDAATVVGDLHRRLVEAREVDARVDVPDRDEEDALALIWAGMKRVSFSTSTMTSKCPLAAR